MMAFGKKSVADEIIIFKTGAEINHFLLTKGRKYYIIKKNT